jgi:hypothetical protein
MMIVNRPRRQIGCRIGVHWWSVLSCEGDSDTWRRHCLFCGRRQFFADTASNGLEDKRLSERYAAAVRDFRCSNG